MKKGNNVMYVVFVVSLSFIACQVKKDYQPEINKDIQLENKSNQDAMAGVNFKIKDKQFIHSANIDMDVNNCLLTTNLVEIKVKEFGGFILQSKLSSVLHKEVESVINVDSIKKTTFYQPTADLLVKVPDTALQQFLQYIQSIGEHIRSRVIEAEDVSFDLKSKEKYIENTVISDKKGRIDEQIDILRLKDAIQYSTVTITMAQPDEMVVKKAVNKDANWAKQTSVWSQIWFSVQKGFYQLIDLFTLLIQFWWIAPLFVLGKIAYRKLYMLYAKIK